MNDSMAHPERFDTAVLSMAMATEVVAAGVVSKMYDKGEQSLSVSETIGGHLLAVAALLIKRSADLGMGGEQIARVVFAVRPDTPVDRPFPTQ